LTVNPSPTAQPAGAPGPRPLRVVVYGADAALGRKVSADLVSAGHQVVGVGHRRPESWSAATAFVTTAQLDDVLSHLLTGVDAVALCAAGSADSTILSNALLSSSIRIVILDSPDVSVLRSAGLDPVIIAAPTILGRDVDDRLLRQFTRPVVLATRATADQPLRVVHPDDVRRLIVAAVLGDTGAAGVAATGTTTVREIAAAVGRRLLILPDRVGVGTAGLVAAAPEWTADDGAETAWTAAECVEDFALTCRGRVTPVRTVLAVPWRLARVRDIPAVDRASQDGVKPVPAGALETVGEFDTPIDPRFPAFAATNLSEALPGPFSPSSASVSVLGTRAAGRVIAERLRPGGVVQDEMARRSTAVFGHRVYAGLTSGYFMAKNVPLVNPDTVVTGFFGTIADGMALLGSEHPPIARRGLRAQIHAAAVFAGNLVLLSGSAARETRDFVRDVERFERKATQRDLTDRQLRGLVLLGRDHVVHGWVLASASLLVCTAYGVILRVLSGRDVLLNSGHDVASANSLTAVHRLAAIARTDPALVGLLADSDVDTDRLMSVSPGFADALARELALIGHRGPGEVEMDCQTFADDPRLLIRTVAKALDTPLRPVPERAQPPLWARPLIAAAAAQLRDREVRRDRLVRAIWVVRGLLREYGRRCHAGGRFDDPDDVFYLTIDELDAPPADIAAAVARRRAQRCSLEQLVPPAAFSGTWAPAAAAALLSNGESLHGLGVGPGRVRGRVRVVRGDTVNDVEPGEILVATVTDVGYTPAFAYVAAVVTEVGGPISHAAIVAREYGVPCVVNATGAAQRLRTGTLIEVDGESGVLTVLDA
jgi:phosphohistidine swiveling domain-containing protein